MKAILLFVLLACSECCLGQTDTNFIAGGDWSEPVKDEHAGTLRGRLLVYEGEEHCPMGESIYGNARVYLELQHGFNDGRVIRLRQRPQEFPHRSVARAAEHSPVG